MRIEFLILIVFVVLLIDHCAAEPKRSFGIGSRSRPKTSNMNVRRRGHAPVETPVSHNHRSQSNRPPPKPSAPAASPVKENKPVGAPPPYSATGTAAKSNQNIPPPGYSPSYSAPPSYSAATGSMANGNYPRQTYSGVNNGMNSGGVYSGYNTGPHAYQQPSPGFGNAGHFGYSQGMGGYGHPMGSPGFGNSYGGGGMMQSPYVIQQKSSPFSGIAGNVLTGLAVWQLARGFGGSHHNTQHIYHHYDNQNPQQATQSQIASTSVNGQPALVTDLQDAKIDPKSISAGIEDTTNATKLAPYPTAYPESDYQYQFTTIHPSLFPYGRQESSLDYWANSHSKVLNTTSPEIIDSSTLSLISTTSTTSTTSSPTTEQLTTEQTTKIS